MAQDDPGTGLTTATTTLAVNPQIIDATTAVNVKVLGEAPAEAMGMVYLGAAHSLSISLATAAQAQAGLQQIGNAIVGATAKMIVALEKGS